VNAGPTHFVRVKVSSNMKKDVYVSKLYTETLVRYSESSGSA
jgi:hypothetical protein